MTSKPYQNQQQERIKALLKEQDRLLKLLEMFVIWHGTDDRNRPLYYDQLNQALVEARKLVQK